MSVWDNVGEFEGKLKRKNIEDAFPYFGSWIRIDYYDMGYNRCTVVGVLRGIRIVDDSVDTGIFVIDGTEVKYDHAEKVKIALVNGL